MTRSRVAQGAGDGDVLDIAHEHRGAAQRKRTPKGAFDANAGGVERASGGAGGLGGSAASVGGYSRLIATGEVRSEVGKAATRSVSFTARRRGDRAGRPGRRAGEGGCDHPGPIARRIGSSPSSQSGLLACSFAAGGAN